MRASFAYLTPVQWSNAVSWAGLINRQASDRHIALDLTSPEEYYAFRDFATSYCQVSCPENIAGGVLLESSFNGFLPSDNDPSAEVGRIAN